MVVSCCVIGCANRFNKGSGLRFFRFPDSQPKRTRWINAMRRKNWVPNDNTRVCSIHFLSGNTTNDANDPDYEPNLQMGHKDDGREERARKRKTRLVRIQRRSIAKEEQSRLGAEQLEGAETLLSLSSICPPPLENLEVSDTSSDLCSVPSIYEELDEMKIANQKLQEENKQIYAELARLQQENRELKDKLKKCSFTEESLQNNDSRTVFYTGFPNYKTFNWALHYCLPVLPISKVLSSGSVFLLIFMKLRLNLINLDLAYRFNVSEGLVSKILNEGLPAISRQLSFLMRWPTKGEIIRTLPSMFKPTYKNCRVIIDCSEIFCERGRNLTLRALTWSNYKHHNTLKLLVGITPAGAVSFVSNAYGARVSDKVITQKSGFLNNLEHGDLVLADRGFLVEDDLASRGARLVIPSFTKGQKQLSMKSVEQSRRLARVRIHVERMMERLKNFRILAGILPITLVPHIDNIVLIIAAVSNLHKKLVK